MKAGALKMIVLGAALSLSATGYLVASNDRDEIVKDRCEPTGDLGITTSSIDIDRKGQSEIKGRIINRSKNIDYRDVRVRINFLDEKGKQIGSQVSTVKGHFDEGDSEGFSLKFEAPRETEQATYSVECAIKD